MISYEGFYLGSMNIAVFGQLCCYFKTYLSSTAQHTNQIFLRDDDT